MSSLLLLPGQPGFYETLQTARLPHAAGSVGLVRQGSGVVDWLSPDSVAIDEYLYGGEYDEVISAYDDYDDYEELDGPDC